MRVSNEQLKLLMNRLDSRDCDVATFPFPVCSAGQLARDLQDARQRIAELEADAERLTSFVKALEYNTRKDYWTADKGATIGDDPLHAIQRAAQRQKAESK